MWLGHDKFTYTYLTHIATSRSVNCFKPFKATFGKEKDSNMIQNNHNEPNKTTLTRWVDKALHQSLSKQNIKNGFNPTRT
jgi:hypothetical protein